MQDIEIMTAEVDLKDKCATNNNIKDSSDKNDNIEQSLYQKSQKIYPRQVHGIFAYLRVFSILLLLGIFYHVPWLEWDGRQAVLFDLPARKFYILGLTIWPQDFFYLAFLLIIAALTLFFFTALAGRLWCGYACPQTVWTEAMLFIERFIEGSRIQQMRLDESPLTLRKFIIKATKHSIWLIFSVYSGYAFVSYFTPATELAHSMLTFSLGPWESFWVFFYSALTYGNAGWMREQFCIYMCPYARFQSAMFDDNTLTIFYDKNRGEKRGSRRPGTDHRSMGLGDCIDCTLCVQVCPTGIDIRNGLQYECIGCSACIDVCDDVMEKMEYSKGLVRYTSQNALDGNTTRIIRPRIIIYGLLLLTFFALFGFSLSQRIPIGIDIIRDRNQLYRETAGLIENVYTLKILNMDDKQHVYHLEVDGIREISLFLDAESIIVDAGKVLDLPVRLRANEDVLSKRSNDVYFYLSARDDNRLHVRKKAKFLGPAP
jgi:cytochrome c oxidase accessory protein FixG